MASEDKQILNRIMSSYSLDASGLEDENRILQQTIANLRTELLKTQKQLEHFMKPPLLVAEVREHLEDNVLVRLNNGNEFFVEKAAGWALRQYSKIDATAVRRFIKETELPALTVREGLKWLKNEDKKHR